MRSLFFSLCLLATSTAAADEGQRTETIKRLNSDDRQTRLLALSELKQWTTPNAKAAAIDAILQFVERLPYIYEPMLGNISLADGEANVHYENEINSIAEVLFSYLVVTSKLRNETLAKIATYAEKQFVPQLWGPHSFQDLLRLFPNPSMGATRELIEHPSLVIRSEGVRRLFLHANKEGVSHKEGFNTLVSAYVHYRELLSEGHRLPRLAWERLADCQGKIELLKAMVESSPTTHTFVIQTVQEQAKQARRLIETYGTGAWHNDSTAHILVMLADHAKEIAEITGDPNHRLAYELAYAFFQSHPEFRLELDLLKPLEPMDSTGRFIVINLYLRDYHSDGDSLETALRYLETEFEHTSEATRHIILEKLTLKHGPEAMAALFRVAWAKESNNFLTEASAVPACARAFDMYLGSGGGGH